MTNVVSMERTCEYWVKRAQKHRMAGRYDEAMMLLSKAKEQFGLQEKIELEMAVVYDEMGCEDEAARSYLRVARLGGEEAAQALFQLAASSLSRRDLKRAQSYAHRFLRLNKGAVSDEMTALLMRHIQEELTTEMPKTLKKRAKQLEDRAMERLQTGKPEAALRLIRRASRMCPNARREALMACCYLVMNRAKEALEQAQKAHQTMPRHVQSMCLLADAYSLAGDKTSALKMLYLAAMRAKTNDDLFAVMMESAKSGADGLTVRMTERLLGREPFHTRAMCIRACALINLGRLEEAERILGRLCVLLPEDTVCETLYRCVKEGKSVNERLTLGVDVSHGEAGERALKVFCAFADADRIDEEEKPELARICAWMMRTAMVPPQCAIIAVRFLIEMDTEQTRCVLLDALTDPGVEDRLKMLILQLMTEKYGVLPFDVDIGGSYTQLVAGAQTSRAQTGSRGQETVQKASDAVSRQFPDAPSVMLGMWTPYLDLYGAPRAQGQAAASAALEYLFHRKQGRSMSLGMIARRWNVSRRLCAVYVRRIQRANDKSR